MKKKFIILLLYMCYSATVIAYTEKDSLDIKTLYESGWPIESTLPDSALSIYAAAKQKSMQLNFSSGVALYYANASAAWNVKGHFRKGLALNQEGLAYCLRVNNVKATAKCYGNIAASYQYLSMYDSAVFYYLKACTILEQSGDSTALTTTYSNLTGLFCNLNRVDECIIYGNKALTFHSKGFWKQGLSNTYTNLGNGYVLKKDYKNAETSFYRAISIAQQQNDAYTLSVVYGSLEQMLRDQKRYKQMLVAAEQCLFYTKEINSKDLEANAYNVLANAYYYNKAYKDALVAGLKGLEISKQQGIKDEARKISATLAYTYAALHDIEHAEQYATYHDSIQERILNEKVYSSIEVIQAKLKEEKLQASNIIQEEQLQQKRFWIIMLLLILVSLVTIAIAYYIITVRDRTILETQNKLQLQEINSLEQQKKIEATDAIIKGEEQERTRIAKDLHDSLGSMLSSVKYALLHFKDNTGNASHIASSIQPSINLLDESISELRRISQNLLPESLLQFGLDVAMRDFCTHIHTSSNINLHYESFDIVNYKPNTSIDISIFRMGQELINNAIKHAHANQIIVQLSFSPNKINILVEDNGVGFDTTISYTGMGVQNLQNRVAFLKGQITYKSEQKKGTTVNIVIPTS